MDIQSAEQLEELLNDLIKKFDSPENTAGESDSIYDFVDVFMDKYSLVDISNCDHDVEEMIGTLIENFEPFTIDDEKLSSWMESGLIKHKAWLSKCHPHFTPNP